MSDKIEKSNQDVEISVIIPTYNGAGRIQNTLRALEEQTYKDFELLVVIDGSTDNTRDILKKKSFIFKSFRIIEQQNKGRAAVRNRGAKEAIGDILIFYDDDMRPESNSVVRHREFHKKFINAICTGNQLEDNRVLTSDIQKFKAHLSRKWIAKYHNGLNRLDKHSIFLTAANLSVAKDLFIKIGEFDERLTDAEDFEFGLRAVRMNYSIYFDKDNIAWHDDFITCKRYIKRQRQYKEAHKRLKEIIPASLARQELTLDSMPWYEKSVYSLFAKSYWVSLIDQEKLTWLPIYIRYKIYDWVITGLSKIYPERNIDD